MRILIGVSSRNVLRFQRKILGEIMSNERNFHSEWIRGKELLEELKAMEQTEQVVKRIEVQERILDFYYQRIKEWL